MTHRRKRLPGSFQDELGGVIERVAPPDSRPGVKPDKQDEKRVRSELNDRTFKQAWRSEH